MLLSVGSANQEVGLIEASTFVPSVLSTVAWNAFRSTSLARWASVPLPNPTKYFSIPTNTLTQLPLSEMSLIAAAASSRAVSPPESPAAMSE